MKKTKEIQADYRHLQEAYLTDIDMSGGLYLEYQNRIPKPKILDVTHTNFGCFYKAKLDGERISKEQLFDILGIKNQGGFRLEYHLNNLQKRSNDYIIKIWEMDVT